MFQVQVDQAAANRWEKTAQQRFAHRINALSSKWGGILRDHVVGQVEKADATEAEHRAGNWEWENSYSSPHSKGGKPSIAVREAMMMDVSTTAIPVRKSGWFSFGAGNTRYLNTVSPHWAYYEYGSGKSFKPDALMTPAEVAEFRHAYVPKRSATMGEFTFFDEKAKGTRRRGRIKILKTIPTGLWPRVQAFEGGTPGRRIYMRSRSAVWAVIQQDAKKFASRGES